MLSLKQKMQVLESVKETPFKFDKVPDYLKYVRERGMGRIILTRIFEQLVALDAEISANYDLLSEDEWNELFAMYSTPLPEASAELSAKIGVFSMNFSYFCDELFKPASKIKDILEITSTVYANITRNVQFVVFKAAMAQPKHVFGYLMTYLRKHPKTYAPFFSSLLVRLRLDHAGCGDEEEFRLKCVRLYAEYARTRIPGASLDALVLGQHLLYILCFFPEYRESLPVVRECVDAIFDSKMACRMNADVIGRFSALHKYTVDECVEDTAEVLHFFPFDAPVCPAVYDIIRDGYNPRAE